MQQSIKPDEDSAVRKAISVSLLSLSTAVFGGGCDQFRNAGSADETFEESLESMFLRTVGANDGVGDAVEETFDSILNDSPTVYYALPDKTLLCLQSGQDDKLAIYKSANGYAEFGAKGFAAGTGIGIDGTTSNLYTRINYLEALAYVNGDWKKFQNAALTQAAHGRDSIDPTLFEEVFSPLVTDPLHGFPPSTNAEVYLVNYGDMVRILAVGSCVPVYIPIGDGSLLRVSQEDEQVTFARNAAGYGVVGAEGSVVGFGVGTEMPVSNHYSQIYTGEALALFDGDPGKIFEAVALQARIISDSVWPNYVLAKLSPNLAEPSITQVRIADSTAPDVGSLDFLNIAYPQLPEIFD